MKKFVAVPAIIALVLVLSLNVQATAPIVDDIPDVKMIYGAGDAADIFDLNDYVVDFDDGDAGLTWSGVASGYTADSPAISIDGNNVATIGGLAISDYGEIVWSATETSGSQEGSDASVVTYSDFWLTRPSLTAALFAYDDSSIEVQPVYVVRDVTTTLESGASLLSGSGLSTADWTVNMRGLIDRTTYPLVTNVAGVSTYGLNVAINADGTFTIDPGSTLTAPLEIGFRASKDATDAPKDEWSGARVIAAQDILPRESNSGDILKEHCFENTGLTVLPNDDTAPFKDVSDTYGWSAYYPSGSFVDYTALGATADAVCSIVDISSVSGLPEGPVGGPLPWGSCLKMNMPMGSGNLIYSAKYDYPDPGDTLCLEFWVATDVPTDQAKERPIFRGGFSTSQPTHELSEFEAKAGVGSALPLAGEGWVKIQTYYTAQVNTSLTTVDHFRVILFTIRRPKTYTSDINVYVDNVSVYKVKSPIDVTNYRSEPMVMKDALAYGSTAIGMGDYPSTDDLEGTFERTTSKASHTDPVEICGIFDLSANVTGANFNTLGSGDYTLAVSADNNFTYSSAASKSLKIGINASAFNYTAGSPLSVVSLTTLDPCDLYGQGINGTGIYGLTFWMRTSAVTYYSDTGTGKYGHIPTVRYGIYDGGPEDPNTTFVYSKQNSASAMPVLADGWKKFSIIYPASNTDLRGLMLAYYIICGSLQGSADFVYIDDITFQKVQDKANYYDDSLFN